MNETLSRLFSKARKTGGAIAYGAGQQAAVLTDRACRGARLVRLKASVHSQLRTVGQMLYDTHAGHPADSEELLDQLRRIDTLNAEIARSRSGASAQRCRTCGAEARTGDRYCRQCGQKL